MKNKKFLSMILTVAVICSLVGCRVDKAGITETTQVTTVDSLDTETTQTTTTSVVKENSDSSETVASLDETAQGIDSTTTRKIYGEFEEEPIPEEYMPEGWTMEDFENMLIINGKTLSFPITINKIKELDDRFTFQSEYIDENSNLYNGTKLFLVNVIFNGEQVFMLAINSEINNFEKILDNESYYLPIMRGCKKANLDITTSCGIDFNSTYEDLIELFGEPSREYTLNQGVEYKFYSGSKECYMNFDFDKNNKIDAFTIRIIPIERGK